MEDVNEKVMEGVMKDVMEGVIGHCRPAALSCTVFKRSVCRLL